MEDYRDSQTCKAKVGLLFLRDCGSMATTKCVLCGRPICRKHSVETEKGILCPECAAPSEKIKDTTAVKSARMRSNYYSGYGYRPYYYGNHLYYSDNDYRTFDETSTVYEEPPSDTGDDFFDSDDAMES